MDTDHAVFRANNGSSDTAKGFAVDFWIEEELSLRIRSASTQVFTLCARPCGFIKTLLADTGKTECFLRVTLTLGFICNLVRRHNNAAFTATFWTCKEGFALLRWRTVIFYNPAQSAYKLLTAPFAGNGIANST